jgi:hypothetical protein
MLTDEPAQHLVQDDEVAAEGADVSHLAVAAGVGRGDVDTVLVQVLPDLQRAGFLHHGPSPCKFAGDLTAHRSGALG